MRMINLLAIVVTLQCTAYCHTGNPTASGVMPAVGMCAMDKVNGVTVPFGSKVTLPDGRVLTVTAVAAGAAPGDLVMAARKYAAECKAEKTEQKYIAMPQNFLKDKWRTYIPKYSPGCTKCHGKGVYEDGDRMVMCNCDRRYG